MNSHTRTQGIGSTAFPRIRPVVAIRCACMFITALAILAAGCASSDRDHASPERDGMQASGESSATMHPDTSSPEWIALFNEDLSNAVNPGDAWFWDEDRLTANADSAIFSMGSYDDYVLDLEVMFEQGANSGIILHTSDTQNWIPHSVEVQIADDALMQDDPTHGNSGSFYGHVAPSEQRIYPAGEWNRFTITAQGDSMWVVLNGMQVSEIDLRDYDSAEVNPDGTQIPSWLSTPLAELPSEGHIGLQGKHGQSSVWFRNIRIRTL